MKIRVVNYSHNWGTPGLRWVAKLGIENAIAVLPGSASFRVAFIDSPDAAIVTSKTADRGACRWIEINVYLSSDITCAGWDRIVDAISSAAAKSHGHEPPIPRTVPSVIAVERMDEPTWIALGRVRAIDDLPRKIREAEQRAADFRARAWKQEEIARRLKGLLAGAEERRAAHVAAMEVKRAAWTLSQDGQP